MFIGKNEYVMEGFNIVFANAGAGRLSITSHSAEAGWACCCSVCGRCSAASRKPTTSMPRRRTGSSSKRGTGACTSRPDGEVTVMDTPLEYRIRARALRVIAPTEGKASEVNRLCVRAFTFQICIRTCRPHAAGTDAAQVVAPPTECRCCLRDLTQRARAEQFREARAFLDTLPMPQM